jgi:uncharacterized spore protein YtfJ
MNLKIINKSGNQEEFTNPVPQLLDALKNLLLLEKDFNDNENDNDNENENENSKPEVYQRLKSFLLELEGEMEEERCLACMGMGMGMCTGMGTGKSKLSLKKKDNQSCKTQPQPQPNGNQAELSIPPIPPISPRDFEKKLRTVHSIYRLTRSKYGRDRRIPVITLSGFWLADYGFGISERFSVYAGEDRLILKKEKNIVKAPRARKRKPSKVHPVVLGVSYD